VRHCGGFHVAALLMPNRYLGTWTLPSGNSCDVYLISNGQTSCGWDGPLTPAWPWTDLEVGGRRVSFPDILRAVATAAGRKVLGLSA